MKYAIQFGHEDVAFRCATNDANNDRMYPHAGFTQSITQANTPTAAAPATPFQASETMPPSDFAINPPEQSQSQEFNRKKGNPA